MTVMSKCDWIVMDLECGVPKGRQGSGQSRGVKPARNANVHIYGF